MLRTLLIAPLLLLGLPAAASADVIVISNRTGREMPISFSPDKGQAQQVTLKIGENMPFYLDGKAKVSFSSPGGSKALPLDANCAYFIGRTPDNRLNLQKIGLGEDGTLMEGRTLPGSPTTSPPKTITVKILVDEEEPGREQVWEKRLRRRVEAASAIFEKYFHLKLDVVAVGTWNSDNAATDFMAALADFEHKVDPAPARVAIGFTSQWRVERGRMHMAGTRGPLHTHILAREGNPNLNEAERLEYLIHELGHFFGAAHSPEQNSVMRPVLGDNQVGRANFHIQFDPVNTLAIAIISDEMRRRNLTRLSELAPETRKRLSQIYTELGRSEPDDPAAFLYAQIVKSESASPLVIASQRVLKQIVRAAIDNRALPSVSLSDPKALARKQGDNLTELLVREAARAAQQEPEDVRTKAFLIAAITGLQRGNPVVPGSGVAALIGAIEPPGERAVRLTVLGDPTMRSRPDLAQHFWTSALLAATNGSPAANMASLDNTFANIRGPEGFSAATLAADRAGARFAQAILEKRLSLGTIGNDFQIPSFMPDVDGLPEKLSADDFAKKYGDRTDPRFRTLLQDIDRRIETLPAYRPLKPLK